MVFNCCQSSDNIDDKSNHPTPLIDEFKKAAANTPPVSDHSVTLESVVEEEEEEQNTLTKTNVVSFVEEDKAEKAAYSCFDLNSALFCCFNYNETAATVKKATSTAKKVIATATSTATSTATLVATAAATAREDNYNLLAPSVFHLQTCFQERIKEAGLDSTATLYDIEDLRQDNHGVIRSKGSKVACPIDGREGAAYVHCINGVDHVGSATHMLSYTWGYRYLDIVDTLVAFCEEKNLNPKKTYIWICCLCNNQHREVEKEVPFEKFKYVFNKRVKGIGNILAMMAPWTSPNYLTRVWCLFEMYSANSDINCTIEIVIPPKEKEILLNSLHKIENAVGENELDYLLNTLANTKVELANASRTQDKENILKVIEEGPGYNGLNVVINQLMRTWVQDTVLNVARTAEARTFTNNAQRRKNAINFAFYGSYFNKVGAHKEALDFHQNSLRLFKSIGTDDEESVARCYNNIGTEYESLGNYEKALEAHTKCLTVFESIFGTDHPNTSTSYFNIGFVYRKLNDNDKALEMFEKSLEIDKKVKEENHIDTAGSYMNIGKIKQQNEDFDGALEMFLKTLTICEATYGKDHSETGVCYGDVGLIYHLRKDYDAAIEMHEKTRLIQESIVGNLHPDTAQVYQNLGSSYYEKRQFKVSVEMHNKAKVAFEKSLGIDHPKSKGAREWIKFVESKLEEVQKADSN